MAFRINKKNSRVIAVLIIVVFFAIAQITNKQGSPNITEESTNADYQESKPSKLAEQDISTTNSKFELNDFRRSANKDGRKLWEITAKRGVYDPDTNLSTLSEPALILNRVDAEPFTVIAQTADIIINGTQLEKANLKGKVTAQLDSKTELKTSQAVFNYQDHKIISNHPVRIENDLLKIRANNMEVDTETQVVKLSGEVSTYIKPKEE